MSKKKMEGYIWRQSVYMNGFKCRCGNQLADPMNGEPKGYVLYDPDKKVIYCNKCNRPVCFFGEMEVDKDMKPGLHGHIEDYLKNQKM